MLSSDKNASLIGTSTHDTPVIGSFLKKITYDITTRGPGNSIF